MKSLKDISAKEIMNKDFESASPEDKLTKIKSKMERNKFREIPLVEDNEFKGIISYREINKNLQKDPTNIKAKKMAHQPPQVTKNDNMIELAGLMRDSGKETLVHLQGNRLIGVISKKDLIEPVKNSLKEFHNLRVKDMMNKEVERIKETEKHGKAKKLMEDKNLSRVPVVDKKDRIMGIITTMDLIRTMVPKEQMRKGDKKGNKESMNNIPAREIMDTNMTLLKGGELPIAKAVKKMKQQGTQELIVIDKEEKPVGVLTSDDLIDYMATFKESEELMVNLVGIEQEGQKELIYEKVEQALKGKISKILNRPRELKIHVKEFQKNGRNKRYSVNLSLYSELGTTIIQKEGWKLLDVMDKVIDSLKQKLTTQKQKRRDRIREQWKKGTYSG